MSNDHHDGDEDGGVADLVACLAGAAARVALTGAHVALAVGWKVE